MNAASTDAEGLSSGAKNLQWLLANLVDEVPGAQSVAVVSSDGLLLASSGAESAAGTVVHTAAAAGAEPAVPGRKEGQEEDQPGPAGSVADLSTLVSGLASLTDGAARLMDSGRVKQTVVTMDGGNLFVMAISDGSLLGVHASAECDLNVVAYQMALFVGRAGHVLTPELRGELRRALEQ